MANGDSVPSLTSLSGNYRKVPGLRNYDGMSRPVYHYKMIDGKKVLIKVEKAK